MYEVKLFDRSKRIVKISWIGNVQPEEVRQANEELDTIIKQFRGKPFDVMVNMKEVKVMIQDTQKELVKHQEWLLEQGMNRAAVVVEGNLAKMQLKRTAKESEHSNEFHFNSDEEAHDFLAAN
ncbi:STAS/SEC14 domain-containing protein [Halalkalibacillus halophilus]|uniref:STAS/SEC14 domain-containing protein n=1 Tax=Halalkalibacillus halophilus TaxID=392827 RepID=UPI000400F7EF|nr:STAS/SEC14 domain-containing protein [Halalkalibacillus halophilus]